MLQRNPSLTPLEIYSILESTAIDMNAAGFDFDSSYGLIDALAAVNTASLPPNDQCNGAISLGMVMAGGPPLLASGSTIDATGDADVAENCANAGFPESSGVWYTFESDLNCFSASTCNAADFDMVLSVYVGNNCENLQCVAGNDDFPGCGLTSFTGPVGGSITT